MDVIAASAPLVWHFDHCRFEEASLELWVAGELAELERKPLEVLRHLLRHAGEVVTKDELQNAIWPARVLSDTVLTKAISRIREVLQDGEQRIIRTVHGYGYRLVAAVSVAATVSSPPPAPSLGLKVGDTPPLRPHWNLVEHLNSGGFGEVWRVVQGKTGETRVYKFALSVEALTALKREITLLRLLRTQLGDSAPLAEIRDWNLEEAPYFLEMSDYPAGNLASWLAAQGGCEALDMAARLALFADIAEAVAQVHAVGVLHKDIKPSNILIALVDGRPRPLLSDFGGGGVLADDLIANAGITQLGFTQTLAAGSLGTPLYAAPELMEGQPQTVRSDVYALGVLLYQLLIGDFRKPLASGWERRIDDELLREDIDAAVQGAPERRLASAQELVERIRNLEARRAARQSERAEQQRRADAEQALASLRLRRRWMLATMVALALGLAVAWVQFLKADRERRRAEAAAATALETGRFMFEGLLSALDPGQQGRTRATTVKDLLDNARRAADERLMDQPEISFHVRTALASAYNQIDDGVPEAKRQEQLAHQALARLAKDDPRRAVQLIPSAGLWVVSAEDHALFESLLVTARHEFGPDHPGVLGLLAALSDAEFRYGSLQAARQRVQEALELSERHRDVVNAEDNIAFGIRLAREDADFATAEALLPASEKWVALRQPAPPVSLAYLPLDRGITRVMHGEPERGAADLEAGFARMRELQAEATWYYRYPLAYLAMLRADQQRRGEARQLVQEWWDILQRTSPKLVDMPLEALTVAETAWRIGDEGAAQALLVSLVTAPEGRRGRCFANHARLQLATMAAEAGDLPVAQDWLQQLRPADWYDYRAGHPREAAEAEARALLLRAQGRPGEAQVLLRRAQKLYAASYARGHWRNRRIARLLAAD
ncbi:hypothetical protein ED208_11730 [Stagnimonas aquatica]|uniref:Uncharacterized protein n=1 Tax=Stagnimonas aquatica TaxID=2689987 RepID=A0A3N0V8D9_9GAMM|nr:winged helix-turn-helix domain-containing protein [Stagnimonas aquatica]ROH89076.1 hypothetical protein ED208_11730 [Stagnimonas aquatica]